ncbi:Protein N-acetyltransferase, RimJ/RimL family [Fictibacillus enclensis]|uniref:Alanine acetyltransferase n=1 Tax=Fictibacillus enclensis TaxID=1017270 RepID=A0A0V8J1C0_9BACL|nr:GNAT family N-acetyltransferase [Fictibacillus enclensis]KSU80881.1 alanine acetyltransferase [Fictibacillus enclensis]SCC32389.1 Protein N-acetyltransferase, RimJ/RimL family [Fictibacillus enclensis]
MLKKRDLNDCHVLFNLMAHPEVFPFVRQKTECLEEFMFLTKQTIEEEERGETISRTILDEWYNPIGAISLYDIHDGCGFLGTWIGQPYFGKGYNKLAKEHFFSELFYEHNINTVFMRIRKSNPRSQKAAEKIPYVTLANETRPDIYQQLNRDGDVYNLYQIEKDNYVLHQLRTQHQHEMFDDNHLKEA